MWSGAVTKNLVSRAISTKYAQNSQLAVCATYIDMARNCLSTYMLFHTKTGVKNVG